jgi:hypothetical protein
MENKKERLHALANDPLMGAALPLRTLDDEVPDLSDILS